MGAGMAGRGVSARRRGGCARALLAGSLILAGGLALKPPPAQAQQGAPAAVRVSVPAGALEGALLALGRQANLRLVYASALTADKTTSGVSGQLTSRSALAQLLAGTGLSYSFTGANTVRIFDPNTGTNDTTATVDGAIALDMIDVTGGRADGGFTSDTPYETAGSVSHISREQMDRIRIQTPGDIFRSTPGVIHAGSRGTSIQPNIRGLQGSSRVKTTIDGAEESVSSYRGYIGNRDETYIDPDLIGGVDITKGPAGGTIGGLVEFRTISAQDILREGRTWGVQIKGGVGNNTISPPPEGTRHTETEPRDRPSFFEGKTWNGSIAGAVNYENFEGVVAYAKRVRGNYFAGTRRNGDIGVLDRWGRPSEFFSAPGQEVPNSSEDTESFLVKGKLKWNDNQSLELGYRSYDSISGDVIEQGSLLGMTEWPMAHVRVGSHTARYRWDSAATDLINVRANLWRSKVEIDANGARSRETDTWGVDIANTFEFRTSLGFFSVDAGADYSFQDYWADPNAFWGGGEPGERTTAAGFTNLKYGPTDWLSFTGGVRYDWFETQRYLDLPRSDFTVRDGSGISYNAGVTVTPITGLQLFGLFKQGLKPTLVREFGLDPERSNNYELGFNILRNGILTVDDKFRFKAAVFHNTYDDYIIRWREAPNLPYLATNIDKAVYKGFELSAAYDAGRFFFEGAFTNYMDVEYCLTSNACSPYTFSTDFGGGYVPPKFHGSVTAGIRLFDQKLTLGARTHFSSGRIGGSVTQAGGLGPPLSWPQYGIYDIFGGYKLNEYAELKFSVENITDEYYFDALSAIGRAAPGRTVTLSFTARF